jgi:hypothetical protein
MLSIRTTAQQRLFLLYTQHCLAEHLRIEFSAQAKHELHINASQVRQVNEGVERFCAAQCSNSARWL